MKKLLVCFLLCWSVGCGGDSEVEIVESVVPPPSEPVVEAAVAVVAPPVEPSAPLPPPDQDSDGVPDDGDNCRDVSNPDQSNLDAQYAAVGAVAPTGKAVSADSLGDLCDDDRDGDGLHVTYIDAAVGDDSALGTFREPVRSIAAAISLATQYDDEIHLAAGTYQTGDVVWSNGLVLRGGYAAGFIARAVKNDDPVFETVITAGTQGNAIALDQVHDITFDGLHFESTTSDITSSTLITLVNSGATLTDCVLTLNPQARFAAGIVAEGTSVVRVERSMIRQTEGVLWGVGITMVGGSAHLVNNVIALHGPQHTSGIELYGGAGVLIHNTIRTGSAESSEASSAFGVSVANATYVIANNVLATEASTDQIPLLCAGTTTGDTQFTANLLAVAGGQGPQPLAVDCAGDYYFATSLLEPSVPFGSTTLDAVMPYDGETLAAVLTPLQTLVGPLGADSADPSLDLFYNVDEDFFATPREEPTNVGAFE